MRIAMIDNSRGWGGAEQILMLLSMGLRARGHEVTVFLRAGATTVGPFRQAGIPVHTIPRKGVGIVTGVAQLVRIIRRERFDLIHVHRNHDLLVGKVAALAAGLPLLLTQHCQLGSTSSAIINLADRIVAVSHFIGDDMVRRFPVIAGKMQVIHNGIDLIPFANPQPGYWDRMPSVAGARPLLGVIGYFYKKQEELIEMMPAIRQQLPLAKLVIIGRDDVRQPVLEQLARSCGVADAVVFPGKIPHTEIGDAMAGLDFNVSAFRREGCALNVIESLAVGTPFIGYRSGSYPELVRDGETGLLADTPDEFVSHIARLVADPLRYAAMRDNARQDANARFDVNVMLSAYTELMSGLRKQG